MASTSANKPIRALQTLPRDVPLDIQELRRVGISSALASHYVRVGWLERLGRGLFIFPRAELRLEPCLKFLAELLPGLHVGGKTALARRGVRHNLPIRERLCLWGNQPARLPEWFTKRFPAYYVARQLFGPKLAADFGLQPLPESPDGPLVSVPERALLEMLAEVGGRQGVEESRNIMEGVRSLRPDVLTPLLRSCRRVKVVRLCAQWAEELKLDWAPQARAVVPPSTSRWVSRLPDGTTLILKP